MIKQVVITMLKHYVSLNENNCYVTCLSKTLFGLSV